MAGNIQGITIQFRGETSSLDQAIKKINSEIKSTDSELKKVNNALKFNPTSVELWRQKQDLLKQKISETKEKLDVLKDTQKKVDSGEIQMSVEEYRNLKREIVESESKLKTFNAQLRQIGNANLKALSMQFKEVGDKLSNVGQTMTTKVTAPIVAGYTLASKYASDYEENLNKLDVAFGSNSDSVKKWAENAREAYGLSKVQATDAASAFGALGKGIGLSEKEAAGMSTTLTGLSADLGSYFNVGVDESAKALEGIFTGESEALKKFGVVMNDTNLEKFAADQGLVWKEMDQTEKTMLRYQFVLDKTKDAQGDFARTNDGTANSLKIFQASVQDLATSIGTFLLPIVTPIIQKITELLNKFNELDPKTQKIITITGLVVAAVGPVLLIVGKLASSIGAIVGLAGTLGVTIGALAGPILIVIGVLTTVIALGVVLYKNWDTIKAKAAQLAQSIKQKFFEIKASVTNTINGVKSYLSTAWSSIKSTASAAWNEVKEAITSPINKAKDAVKTAIDKIKRFFPIDIGNIFKNVKTPHFSLKTSSKSFGKLGTISYPTGIDVSWYKTGGIFDSPSVIGVGEAGPEAVVPLDKLWQKLDAIADSSTGGIVININGANKDPREIAAEVKRMLIQETKRERLAWQ